MARSRRRGGRPRARKAVSLPDIPFNGDHGTGTQAATANTIIEPITDKEEPNPNNMGRRRRVNVIATLSLTMRQEQAANAIRDAYSRVEMLSSGTALKERVDASPKPDAAIAAQCDANSWWVHVTKPILRADRALVEHVCCHNLPLRTSGVRRANDRLKVSLDRVADWVGC